MAFEDHFWHQLYKVCIFVHMTMRKITKRNIRIRGMGFLLKRIKRPFIFSVNRRQFVFWPDSANAYGTMVAGYWNEPETHLFFEKILSNVEDPVTFIDVGSSVGEMVIDLAGYDQVKKIYAFEPLPECAEAIRQSANYNLFNHLIIIQKAVSREKMKTSFKEERSLTASHIADKNSHGNIEVDVTSLDLSLPDVRGQVLLLIDVEGHELFVLEGSLELIRRTRPIIVFEFNDSSRQFFNLEQVERLLGKEYLLCRLRQDGLLDKDFSSTWNCVALPREGRMTKIASTLLLEAPSVGFKNEPS